MTDAAAAQTEPQRIPTEVWVLVAASFVIALGYGVVAPALPAFALAFNVGVGAAAAVVSAFGIMRLAFAPATGPLVRRLGERWVYMSGLLIVAASMLAVAFAQSYWQLMVFRGLGGIGSVMFSVSAMGLMIRIAPPEIRGRVSGVYSSSFVLGSICGPLLGGALVGFGLQVPFIVYAVALVIATLVVGIALRRSSLAQRVQETGGVGLTVRAALQDSAYRAAIMTAAIFGWVFSMRISLLPLFFAQELGQPAAVAGYALAAYALGDVLAMFPAGRASDRYGRRPFILTGLVVIAGATAALGFTQSLPAAFLVTALAGLGTGLVAPTLQATVADVLQGAGRSGGALSAYQMSQDAGTIVGPLCAGAIAQFFGFTWAFVVTGVLCLVAFGAWTLARETRVVSAEVTAS